MLPLETGTPVWGHGIQGAFPGLSDALCYSSLTSNCNSSGCGPNHSGQAQKAAGWPRTQPGQRGRSQGAGDRLGAGVILWAGTTPAMETYQMTSQGHAALLGSGPDCSTYRPVTFPIGPPHVHPTHSSSWGIHSPCEGQRCFILTSRAEPWCTWDPLGLALVTH